MALTGCFWSVPEGNFVCSVKETFSSSPRTEADMAAKKTQRLPRFRASSCRSKAPTAALFVLKLRLPGGKARWSSFLTSLELGFLEGEPNPFYRRSCGSFYRGMGSPPQVCLGEGMPQEGPRSVHQLSTYSSKWTWSTGLGVAGPPLMMTPYRGWVPPTLLPLAASRARSCLPRGSWWSLSTCRAHV